MYICICIFSNHEKSLMRYVNKMFDKVWGTNGLGYDFYPKRFFCKPEPKYPNACLHIQHNHNIKILKIGFSVNLN